MTKTEGLTYVVTGGCGFLGSNIVDMLVQKGTNISEIRVVDTKLDNFKSPEKKGIKVTPIRGDITDVAQMTQVCAGADVVIHTASVIDVFGLVSEGTLWNVNVKGTETLLQCCVNQDVRSFVYTSSREAVGPNSRGDPLEDGDENTPYDSSSPLLPYGRTKAAAEAMVLQWNGRRTDGGKTLHTCSLRPGGMYGGSGWTVMRIWQEFGKELFKKPQKRISRPSVKSSCPYVGNVAWAHLLAAQTLLTSPNNAGGEAFFIDDDTPAKDEGALYGELCAPIGISWDDSLVLPLPILYSIAYALSFVKFVCKPFYTFVPRLTPAVLTIVNTNFYFNYKKATRLLGYKPLFSWEESKQKTWDGLLEWKAREFDAY
ncbi:3 beta-hydroxysteroid dehydrogenase type 7-like [Branchiostoma floridae]|uniref:3 beta-hydroxysteroid dehydrogenase type 7-like n=1 Tax=Branchiostoma floridae TaxID=7739 RepID=A0A9J7HI08_BRAFL|nr:3 beta-hydroxysteroid dehydrogenase type 7-like [Branchiostoma floridae]